MTSWPIERMHLYGSVRTSALRPRILLCGCALQPEGKHSIAVTRLGTTLKELLVEPDEVSMK